MTIRNLIAIIIILLITSQSQIVAQNSNTGIEDFDGTLRRIQIPILMYHYVGELPNDADDIRRGLTVSETRFREQLDYLKDNGYQTISLAELDNSLTIGNALPNKPVILSFDDGHDDHIQTVYPILIEYGYIGTFFIVTNFADHQREAYMTWDDIQILAEAGMDVQAHTKSHFNLQSRDHDFYVYEIVGSVESLEIHLNQDINFLAYPAGRYDEATLTFMEVSGLSRAVTTEFGMVHTTDNRFQLSRVRITESVGYAGMAQLLGGG